MLNRKNCETKLGQMHTFRLHMKVALTLNVIFGGVNLIQDWDSVGASFARSVFGASQDVSAALCDWNGSLLNRRRLLPSLLEDTHQHFA